MKTNDNKTHTDVEGIVKEFSSKFSHRFLRIAELADAGKDKLYGTALAHLESDIIHHLRFQAEQYEKEKREMVAGMIKDINQMWVDELSRQGRNEGATAIGFSKVVAYLTQKYGVDLSE